MQVGSNLEGVEIKVTMVSSLVALVVGCPINRVVSDKGGAGRLRWLTCGGAVITGSVGRGPVIHTKQSSASN